ncbi:hypothetical protein EHP00_2276 [Ecytonucleospora hepatopenaei]|uniref:Uncharacterized protein n=1 Tax=Ecytonucleospora hepatopenaei TaxID=646526 RepID=A0A1W0E3J2_9MICR|nr:hypothetical protein EHP00_2276 [Ecytonucleospora hepatopenaei]
MFNIYFLNILILCTNSNVTENIAKNIDFLISTKLYHADYNHDYNKSEIFTFGRNTSFTICSGELLLMVQIANKDKKITYANEKENKTYNFEDGIPYVLPFDKDDKKSNDISFYVDNYFMLNKGAIIKVKDNLSNKEYNYKLLHNVFIDIKGKTDLLVINKDTKLRSARYDYVMNYYPINLRNDQNLKYYKCFNEKNDRQANTKFIPINLKENESVNLFTTNNKNNQFNMKILNTKVSIFNNLIFDNCKNYINFKYNDNNQLEDYKFGDKINFNNLKLRNILFNQGALKYHISRILNTKNSSDNVDLLYENVNVYLTNTKSVSAKSLQSFKVEKYTEKVIDDIDDVIKVREVTEEIQKLKINLDDLNKEKEEEKKNFEDQINHLNKTIESYKNKISIHENEIHINNLLLEFKKDDLEKKNLEVKKQKETILKQEETIKKLKQEKEKINYSFAINQNELLDCQKSINDLSKKLKNKEEENTLLKKDKFGNNNLLNEVKEKDNEICNLKQQFKEEKERLLDELEENKNVLDDLKERLKNANLLNKVLEEDKFKFKKQLEEEISLKNQLNYQQFLKENEIETEKLSKRKLRNDVKNKLDGETQKVSTNNSNDKQKTKPHNYKKYFIIVGSVIVVCIILMIILLYLKNKRKRNIMENN